MKKIYSTRVLREFWLLHPDAEQHLKSWYEVVARFDWQTPNDVKRSFGKVSILKNGRIVFNIKGNRYRLVAKINYQKQTVFILFIGTHGEYDKIDADKI